MRKANLNGVRPFIKKRPLIGRLLTLVWLIVMPILTVGYVIAVGCREVVPEVYQVMVKMLGVIFLPWGDDQ